MVKSSRTFFLSASIINAENGSGDEPGGIALVIDDDLVANIRHLGEIVKQNGLYRVETFDSRPTWLDGAPRVTIARKPFRNPNAGWSASR